MTRLSPALALLMLLILSACGGDKTPTAKVPSWAKVAPEQIAEAKKHGVPVAFENEIGMRFVLIPAGTFLMGSPEDEALRFPSETQQEVTITRPFFLQITEVTNGTFRQFRPDHDSGGRDRGVPQVRSQVRDLNRDRQPTTNVSWNDARAFLEWLTAEETKHGYRLPTESEWEYACRAGTTTTYAFGDTLKENEASLSRGLNRSAQGMIEPPDVGSYPPNAWGLHDMHGSMNEWCADWLAEWEEDGVNPYGSKPATDPTGPDTGKRKIMRGGSYANSVAYLASAARGAREPGWRVKGWSATGFRLVIPLLYDGEYTLNPPATGVYVR